MKGITRSFCRCMMPLLLIMHLSPSKAYVAKAMQFESITFPYDANVVESVYKDCQGMMWFATRRGLFSYDGYNIRRLFEGNYHVTTRITDDIMCIGGDNGLRWLDLKSEKLVTPYGDVPETGDVRALMCRNGILYVGTKSNGLFCLDLKKKIWQRYSVGNSKNDIIFSFEPVGNCIYIAHYSGLSYLDAKGNIHDARLDDNVYGLWYDAEHTQLWIGTEHNLLCRDMKSHVTKVVVSGGTFNQVVPSPSGEIYLASEYGLKVFNPNSGDIRTISHDASMLQNGLPSNHIHHIYCDEDNIWIATDRGVAFAQKRNTFETIRLTSISGSNDGNVFSKILVDSKGDMWLAGDNGILHATSNGTRWFKVGGGLKKNIIRSVYEDRDNDVWIATDASIARYNPQHDSFDYYVLTNAKGRSANWAYDIYEDRQGRMWIATYLNGMFVVDKKTLLSSDGALAVSDSLLKNAEGIVNTIYGFTSEENGILWANTSKGLATIDTNTGEVCLKKKMYIDNMILVDGILWIDIQGEVYRYDTRNNNLEDTHFQVKDGMIEAFVQENKRVWMSTSQGLFYIDTTNSMIHPYHCQGYNFTTGVYVSSDNTIIWGGEDFLCRQSMNDDNTEKKSPKVYVSMVMVGGVPLDNSIPRFESCIELSGSEDISLDIATFAYDCKKTETFWYKIGEKGDWHNLPNGINRIVLSHLSGGKCDLYISTDVNHAKDNVSRYTLVVPYPWYLRWWAWTLYVVFAVMGIYYLTNFYRRREKLRYEQRERERVMALTQEKMDFFVIMSHELKTPLSLIIAPLSKLLAETTNAKLRNSLKSIQNNAYRLNDLIHRILDFKQLETEGENQILASRIDLCNLVSGCVSEFTPSANERNVKISLHTTEPSILVDIDVVKIQMVVRNILSNALKYVNDETGRVVISIEQNKLGIDVSVKDNGPGVPDNELPKLFNRYFVGQNSHDGSGIGLAVVKRYVEQHGGEVHAENANGLKVSFTLPARVYASDEPDIVSMEATTDGPVVMIVDDNCEILEFLTTTLEPSYRCITAKSGEEALSIIKDSVPDMIITDQMMPGMDGTELCHHIRHDHATELIPIIMLTAKDDSGTELKSIQSGADVFMPKPFDLRKLQLHIVQLLNKRRAIEQNVRIENLLSVKETPLVLSNDEELMERVLNIINTNMHFEEFNVAKLCDLLCMNQKQLYRKLKFLTGETPVSLIRQQRMKRAEYLLKQKRFTISEVMYQVGLSSASYFTKSFTKEYGVTPKDFIAYTNEERG